MYNVENGGDGCTMLRIEEMDPTMLRIEEMDVQC